MHDLSALETNEQFGDFEWEGEGEEEGEAYQELEDEESELEAAGELLSVGNEAELDHFLGGLIGKIAKQVGKAVHGPVGNVLGGALKSVARKALPMVATAIGGPIGGGLVASGGLDKALKAFGLELEGLSQEDQELELARRYVRLARGAARRVLRQHPSRNPRNQVLPAVRWAMRRYAPALLGRGGYGPRHHHQGHGQHWPYRRAYPGFYPGGYPAYMPAPAPCPSCGSAAPVDEPLPDDVGEPAAARQAPAPPPAVEAPATGELEMEDELYLGGYAGGGYGDAQPGIVRSGRWIRRGNKIILYGV
jgi:hypothetical protein